MLFNLLNVYAEGTATATAAPTDTQPGPYGGGGAVMLIYFAVLIFVFWFFMIRPQRKKEKELKNMLAALKVGDEVATIGGIHGKIFRIKDDLFILESGAGTNKSYITVDRSAVSRFLRQAPENKVTPIPGADEETETDAE